MGAMGREGPKCVCDGIHSEQRQCLLASQHLPAHWQTCLQPSLHLPALPRLALLCPALISHVTSACSCWRAATRARTPPPLRLGQATLWATAYSRYSGKALRAVKAERGAERAQRSRSLKSCQALVPAFSLRRDAAGSGGAAGNGVAFDSQGGGQFPALQKEEDWRELSLACPTACGPHPPSASQPDVACNPSLSFRPTAYLQAFDEAVRGLTVGEMTRIKVCCLLGAPFHHPPAMQ